MNPADNITQFAFHSLPLADGPHRRPRSVQDTLDGITGLLAGKI